MIRNIIKASRQLNAMENQISVEALNLDNQILGFFVNLMMTVFAFIFAVAGYATGTIGPAVATGAGIIGVVYIIFAVKQERIISKLVNTDES